MKLYRFLSDDDTSAFCHKVTAALNKGWELQAVVKDAPGIYTPDVKLGEQ